MHHMDAFVETGTNVGSTSRYVAQRFDDLPVYSCEPDSEAFQIAQRTLQDFDQVNLYKMQSLSFLERISSEDLLNSLNLFFLDAHGYGFEWPLREEIDFITQNYAQAIILVDDAQVPQQPQFQYDSYSGQVCSLDYIESDLAPNRTYLVCYPNYSEHTSPHHALTGYMFIGYGESVHALFDLDSDDFVVHKNIR